MFTKYLCRIWNRYKENSFVCYCSVVEILGVEADVLIGLSDYVPPKQSTFDLKESEKNLIITYRKLNREGKQKLCERADELLDLGYVEKGDAEKMA